MEIRIPDDQYEQLTERALAAGYNDVPALIEALATEPIDDPRGELNEESMRLSVAELEAAEASMDDGLGIDAGEALRRVAETHGLKPPR